jgi:hypothetical protein
VTENLFPFKRWFLLKTNESKGMFKIQRRFETNDGVSLGKRSCDALPCLGKKVPVIDFSIF